MDFTEAHLHETVSQNIGINDGIIKNNVRSNKASRHICLRESFSCFPAHTLVIAIGIYGLANRFDVSLKKKDMKKERDHICMSRKPTTVRSAVSSLN